jgi:hypothetical protein
LRSTLGFSSLVNRFPTILSTLIHECSGPESSFCAWRKDNSIELGWERLLDDSEPLNGGSTVCRVNLTCSQVENSDCELSTQQTADFLSGIGDDSIQDYDFEQLLSQYGSYSGTSTMSGDSSTPRHPFTVHLVSQLQLQLHLQHSLLHAPRRETRPGQ